MDPSPNLKTGDSFRSLLLTKLWYAISCCMFFQLTLVFIYVCLVNFNLQIDRWFQSVVNVLTSLSTWLYLLPFTIISLTQIITYGKEYLIKVSSQRSRFLKYLSILSIKTVFVALLQMLGGGFAIWLYLSLAEKDNTAIYIECDHKLCLQEGSLFLVINGLWVGLYYFIQVQSHDRILVFPVIYQSKFLHFKSQFMNIFNESKSFSIYPTVYFVIFYNIFGEYICQLFTTILNLPVQFQDFDLLLYVFAWIFSTFYVININFVQFFFELFLTQPIEHSIVTTNNNDAPLHEALQLDAIPILQHLACLDFYLLSIWSPQRRQMLYTLSQPGGHPHTWNRLIESVLKLLSNFQEPLNKALENTTCSVDSNKSITGLNVPPLDMLSQTYYELNEKYPNIRHMSLNPLIESAQIIEVERRSLAFEELTYSFVDTLMQKIQDVVNCIKNLSSYKYLFDDLTEAQVQESFRNGQTIVWIVQGLANVIVKSFDEDPYGVIQKDLPVILSNLVELKTTVEKLSKVSAPIKKGSNGDDFSRKMSSNINNATRRSLTNICRTFNDYLNDIPLERNVRTELLTYV